jgi:hypothetical protein
MYYLLKIDLNGDIKILKNFSDGKNKKIILNNYLIEDNITPYINGVLNTVGLHCITVDTNNYKLFNNIQDRDGYILYGSKYQEDVAFLKFVFYSNTFDGKDLVNDEIKKMKKQKERNDILNKKPNSIK